jgi:hypothetical protein
MSKTIKLNACKIKQFYKNVLIKITFHLDLIVSFTITPYSKGMIKITNAYHGFYIMDSEYSLKTHIKNRPKF